MFPKKPIIAYKRNKNLKDALVRAKLNKEHIEKEINTQRNTQRNNKNIQQHPKEKKPYTDNINIESHTEMDSDPNISILASFLDEHTMSYTNKNGITILSD